MALDPKIIANAKNIIKYFIFPLHPILITYIILLFNVILLLYEDMIIFKSKYLKDYIPVSIFNSLYRICLSSLSFSSFKVSF